MKHLGSFRDFPIDFSAISGFFGRIEERFFEYCVVPGEVSRSVSLDFRRLKGTLREFCSDSGMLQVGLEGFGGISRSFRLPLESLRISRNDRSLISPE